MADTEPMFLAYWGDIRLFVSSMTYQAGQTQVVHNLSSGDVHPVQPRGAQIRTARLQLQFDDFDGASETGVIALRRFQQTLTERRLFHHPVDGTYFAVIGDFEPTIDENSVISGWCEFIPDGDVSLVSPTAFNLLIAGGETAVAQAADQLAADNELMGIGFPAESIQRMDFSQPLAANVNLAFAPSVSLGISANVSASATASASVSATASASVQASASANALAFGVVYAQAIAAAQVSAAAQISGMPSARAFAFAFAAAALDADARASVAAWSEEDVPARRALVDSTRIANSIQEMIDAGGFETELSLWPSYRSAIMLADAVSVAASAASSETSSAFIMRIQDPCALLPLAARIYGGTQAEDRTRQILSLNDIKTAGWLDPGDYLMPARSA